MRQRDRETIYPERLHLKVPAGTNEALDRLAAAQSRTRAETVRQVLRAELEAHGVLPTVSPQS
jgi:predicted transcriptional regulator